MANDDERRETISLKAFWFFEFSNGKKQGTDECAEPSTLRRRESLVRPPPLFFSELSYRQGNSFCSLMSPFTKPQLKRPHKSTCVIIWLNRKVYKSQTVWAFYGWSLLSLAVSRRVPGVVARSDEPFREEEKEMTWKLLSWRQSKSAVLRLKENWDPIRAPPPSLPFWGWHHYQLRRVIPDRQISLLPDCTELSLHLQAVCHIRLVNDTTLLNIHI